jgi:peptidoglycan hydrolase-like protein with peptidoglycan-binding domain
MTVIQAMFNSLARVLTNFEAVVADGVNQGLTLENTRRLQARSGLPVTGIIDRPTWSSLARLYHLFVTRGTL